MTFRVVSFNNLSINDGSNYKAQIVDFAYGLPRVQLARAERSGAWPVVTGVIRPGATKTLRIWILDKNNDAALREALLQAFDPDDEESARLVVEDDDGSNDRYVMAICEDMQEVGEFGWEFIATLAVDGDVRWRAVMADTDTWNITASGQTRTIANGGEDDAYAVFTITPTSAKTGYNVYKRWLPVIWKVASGVANYPYDIVNDSLDTAALVSGGKMQASGADVRVVVDGVEVDYWLDGINTTTTKIWANLDFAAAPSTLATLASAMTDVATVTSIDSATDISGYPSSGILYIDSEAFTYTGKSNSLNRFTGVTRAAKGTAAAAHSAGATMYWIQRDVWITYGNASASAYPSDDDNKPPFNLATSTNTSWDYDEFGADGSERPGQWRFANEQSVTKYTANRNTNASPWEELGLRTPGPAVYSGRWSLSNPCGITNANFQNGEKNSELPAQFGGRLLALASAAGAPTASEVIAAPSAKNTWQAWSSNFSTGTGATRVEMILAASNIVATENAHYLEVADVTVTLNSANTPTVTVGAEQGNYPLEATLRNNTTGEEIRVTFAMEVDEDLEIDTDAKTVTYLKDNSNQFGALEVRGAPRLAWLRLQPGNNQLQFDDEGTVALTIVTEFEERFYG